jgi:flagellar motor component MotA
MPAKSKKQYKFMQAAAHGALKSAGGPSPSVAKEFIEKTPEKKRRQFSQVLRNKMKFKSGMKKLAI